MSSRKKFLMGNWKMNNTLAESKAFCDEIQNSGLVRLARNKGIMVGVCPSFLSLRFVKKHAHGMIVGSQDVHYAKKGAYTSSVSIPMLQEIEVDWTLVGHSEKRTYEGETSFTCNRKIRAAVGAGMHVVYCVGETAKEYDEGITKDIIREQVITGLMGLSKDDISNVVIAYEPVWSIGTGKNASVEIAEDICADIRSLINDIFGKIAAQKIQILYGGSVKPENIHDYLQEEDVDGALVGGASLKASSFLALVENI